MSDSITIQLTELEAEWLAACLGMVMHLARHWDNRTATDHGNRLLAKLTLARIVADGKDPDEWLAQAQAALDLPLAEPKDG